VNICQKLMADFGCTAQNKCAPKKQPKIPFQSVPILKSGQFKKGTDNLIEKSCKK